MKDVKCPICGNIEKGLNLEETNGWFIGSHCKNEVGIISETYSAKIPLYTLKDLSSKLLQ